MSDAEPTVDPGQALAAAFGVTAGRQCGPCSLCCKVMEVPEIEKRRGAWCLSCRPGTAAACTVYKTRPRSCSDFRCLWLGGAFDDEHRPDKTNLVLVPYGDGSTVRAIFDVTLGREVPLVIAHEGSPGASKRGRGAEFVTAMVGSGLAVGIADTMRITEIHLPSGHTLDVPADSLLSALV